MPSVILRCHTDTYVDQDLPNRNNGQGNKIRVKGTTDHVRRGLVFFARPFPRGVFISSATLRLYAHSDWGAGTRVITAKRIEESWKENRVTWGNQPNATSVNLGTTTVGHLTDGDLVEIDVTDLTQDVSDGDPWHGLRLFMDTDEARSFYSSDHPKEALRPKLEVHWSSAPYPPSNLHPGSGEAVGTGIPRLSWHFTDNRGDTEQAFSQVQVSISSSFTSPVYDSGWEANTKHSWSLAGEYTVPNTASRWWRVRVKDGDGNASGWSNTASFKRIDKGAVTIVSPAASPNNFVDDVTPPISWTFSGTQKFVQLRLLRVFNDDTTRELYVFEKQKTDVTSITVRRKKGEPLVKTGQTYRVQVFVWDDVERVDVLGATSWSYAQRDFTYQRSGVPAAVATLTNSVFGPAVVLTWTRATEPDEFCLRVGETGEADQSEEKIILDPEDVRVGVNTFSYTWWRALPGVDYTYEVEAVVNNQHSDANPTLSVTTNPTGIWLVDEEEGEGLRLKGTDSPDLSIGDSATTYDLVGRRDPVRITDSVRGYEGTASGILMSTAQRDVLLDMKGRLKELRFIVIGMNIPVILEEVSTTPRVAPTDTYDASFSVLQTDEFTFDVVGGGT